MNRFKTLRRNMWLAAFMACLSLLACVQELDQIGGDPNPRSKKYHPKHFTQDLTEKAANGELKPVYGRQEEFVSLMAGLLDGNAILVGPTGVGKTTLIHKLAQHIAGGNSHPAFAGKTVLVIQLNRLKNLLPKEVSSFYFTFIQNAMKYWDKKKKGNVIYAIDEFQTISNGGSFGNIFKGFLEKQKNIILATTTLEYDQMELDDAVNRRMKLVFVPEPSHEELVLMARGRSGEKFSSEVLQQAIAISTMNIFETASPDSLFQVLDTTSAYGTGVSGQDVLETVRILSNLISGTQLIEQASADVVNAVVERKNRVHLDTLGKRLLRLPQEQLQVLMDEVRQEQDLPALHPELLQEDAPEDE